MLLSLLLRAILALADARPLPARLHPVARAGALCAIGYYRRFLSRRSGRACLFHPSCSQRAQAALRAHGWQAGIEETARQLRRCSGNYRLLRTADGALVLIASDGTRFDTSELSPLVRAGAGAPAAGRARFPC